MKKVIVLFLLTALLLCGCRYARQEEICLYDMGPLEVPLAQALEQAGYPVLCERPAPGNQHPLALTQKDLVFTVQPPSPDLLPGAWDLNQDGRLACVLITDTENGTFPEALTCASDRSAAAAACGQLLAERGKDVEVLVCTDPQLTLGAMDGVQENGRTVGLDIFLMGMGDDRQLPLLVRSGDLSGVLYPDPEVIAAQVAAKIEDYRKGEPVILADPVPLIVVTVPEIEDYL